MAVPDREIRKKLVDLIVSEDDSDVRGNLAELLAFGEVEVDEEAPFFVGKITMRLLDGTGMFEREKIGTNIFRYSF